MSYRKLLCLYIGSGVMANIGTLLWHIKGKKRKDVYSLGASGALMGLNIYLALKSCYEQRVDHVSSDEDEDKDGDELVREEDSGNDWKKMVQMIVTTTAPDVLFMLPVLQYLSKGAEDI